MPPFAAFIPLIAAGLSAGGAIAGASIQGKNNRRLAQFQADANERYLDRQLEYNTPRNQMSRFQEAGLNPHLAYSQGNPGNQASPLTYPDIKPADWGAVFSQMIPLFNQTAMTKSQTEALDAKTIQTTVVTELNRVQTEVLRKNPSLDTEGFKAIMDSLKATAQMKQSDSSIKQATAEWFTGTKAWKNLSGKEVEGPMGPYMLQRQVDMLDQRFKLAELDEKIKGEVINSKEFQNAILEIQKNFMTNGDITPQHIYQFIQTLLIKLL